MKLQDLKVVYICPDHNEQYRARKKHMDELLTKIGFAPENIEHFKSSTEDYPDCLARANIEIITKYMDEPFLLLEDDVEFTGVDEFDMPEGTDAIYFGLSTSAGHPTANVCLGHSRHTYHSASQVRLISMLATHAILYISAAYKKAVIQTISEHIGQKYNTDVLMSRLQDNYVVLANRRPSFYQSAKFNKTDHQERHTRIDIPINKPVDTTVVTAFYPLKSKHPFDKYLEWIQYFGLIQCSLVIYTDEQMVPFFEKLRRGLPTIIVVKPFGSYEMANSSWVPLWRKHHEIDPEKAIHSPQLYVVWAIKQECVALTMESNPFKTNWFVWCDIGIHRDVGRHAFYEDFPKKVPSVCKPGHIGFLEVKNIPDEFVTSRERLPAPEVSLGGGCIVGDRAAWTIFCPAYKAMLKTMDARGEFIGKDQLVFFRMLTERVMPYQLFCPDSRFPSLLWMQFPCILGNKLPIKTDERFNNNPRLSFVKLIGGLGNQLFQIAAAFAHAKRSCATLRLSNDVDAGKGRPTYFTSFLHKCLGFCGPDPSVPLVREPHFHYAPIPKEAESILGYYQSSRYFADVSGDVKELFDPHAIIKNVVTAKYSSYLTEEARNNTVIVHIRRGDYMTEANKSFHGILTPLYYRAAMALLRQRIGSSAQFLVFSDDIDYCRSIYKEDAGIVFIDESNESVALHFMSQFRYYILSNSSFSWWATYLGEPAAFVVAPDRWFGPSGPQDFNDIYEPGWFRLTAQ